MEDLKKKISEILKNLTSQKNIELYKRFLKFLNPFYILKVWKDNSISVISKIKTSIPILLLLLWILIPGGSSLCDCVELDRKHNYVGGDYTMGGIKYNRSSKQKKIDKKLKECGDEFDGMNNVRRRSSECN